MKTWRIAPTGLGLGFIAMLIVLLLVAVNFSNNLIFTLSFFLMAALMLSIWFVVRNMNGIEVVNVRVKPVHLGQSLVYQIAVKDKVGADHLYLTLNDSQRNFHLSADSSELWNLDFMASKRGQHPKQSLMASCVWPLGLFKVKRELGTLPEVIVYPEALEHTDLSLPLSGEAAHSHADTEELEGLRDYQAGDNIKRIDWRAVARRGQLQVKEFDGADGDPSVWLDWQSTQGLAYEKRISYLCFWILEYQQSGREFGLRLPSIEIAPKRSGQHSSICLNELALMPEEPSS